MASWWRGLDCVVKQKNLLEGDGKTNWSVVATGQLLKSLWGEKWFFFKKKKFFGFRFKVNSDVLKKKSIHRFNTYA